MAARSDGGVACFEVGAGFGVDPAAQVAQPVGALWAHRQAAAAPAVLLVEHRVRVEFRSDVAREFRDKPGVLLLGVAHQDPLCGVFLVTKGRGKFVDALADRVYVALVNVAVLDGISQLGEFGRQLRAGEGSARPDAGGYRDAVFDVSACDAQPLPQQFGDDGACGQVGVIGSVGRFDELAEKRYISPRLIRCWRSSRSATSTRNAFPTESEQAARSRA